ncbi:MAG: MoaD/ThiS family protein [Gammaproteobacteria bacterium]
MARVILTGTLGNRFTAGATRLDIPARTVRELLRQLEQHYPGLGEEIEQALALAIDGEIYQDPYLEALREDSEVFILPKIGAG